VLLKIGVLFTVTVLSLLIVSSYCLEYIVQSYCLDSVVYSLTENCSEVVVLMQSFLVSLISYNLRKTVFILFCHFSLVSFPKNFSFPP
jgi:hypothetical protein